MKMNNTKKRRIFSSGIIVLLLAVLVFTAVQVSTASAENGGRSAQNGVTPDEAAVSAPALAVNTTPLAAKVIDHSARVVRNVVSTPQLVRFGNGSGNGGGLYDNWYTTPQPATPTPVVVGVITSITESVSNVFHHLVFPTQTISDALLKIFKDALNKEQQTTVSQEQQWISAFSSLFQAPPAGAYSDIANGGLKVAAGIAVALFILRLAIYNWNRLLGEDDDAVKVVGDWLTAGVLALVAGPLLDLINRMGWWIMGSVIGNAAGLAQTFAGGLADTSWGSAWAQTTFIGPIITIALMVASMLAVIGIIVAFASGHAVMYVLAAVGPTMMIAGVIPKVRWLRGLWLQAAVVVAFLPVVAAAVFKAGIEAAVHVNGGLAMEIFRILWLFGVTGMLLSMSGILSKFTLGAAGDAMGQLAKIGKGIIETAILAGGAVATGGASAAASGAALAAGGGGGGGGAAGGAVAGASGSGAIGGFPAASQHLQNAQDLIGKADTASSLGFNGIGAHYQRQATGEQIAARQAELDVRMQQQAGGQPAAQSQVAPSSGSGYTPTVNAALSNHYAGSGGPQAFNEGLQGLSSYIGGGILDPSVTPNSLVLSHTGDMMSMVDAWSAHPEFAGSSDPLAATLAAASVSDDFRSLFRS